MGLRRLSLDEGEEGCHQGGTQPASCLDPGRRLRWAQTVAGRRRGMFPGVCVRGFAEVGWPFVH